MKLTKNAHACVAAEKDGVTIVIDPGGMTPNAAEVVAGAAAVLVTHEHFDHLNAEVVTAALAAQPDLRVFAPAPVCETLGAHDGRVTPVSAGDQFEVAGFGVQVYGRSHALIHVEIPVVANVGFLLDEAVYHPGDAYYVPETSVDTLLVPTSGPWTKLGEAIDFVRAVRPTRAIQIHELLLSDLGQDYAASFLGAEGLGGAPFSVVPVGESVTV
jgi:L-ascorbate metabolism protein UlaG (beta-lactamase superfamily)